MGLNQIITPPRNLHPSMELANGQSDATQIGNRNAEKQSGKDCHSAPSNYKTGKRLAEEYGVSERQIRYETEKKIQGAPTGNKNAEKQTSTNRKFENHRTENQPLTREIVAKEYGVSGSTIQQKSINLYVSVGR